MKLGRWILVGLVVAGAGAGGVIYFGRSANGELFVSVPARRGTIAATVAATGTVNPVITVTVGSQVSGQLAALFADYNSVVKKGQIIARLDPSNLEAQVARDRANLASSLANRERAKVEATNAQRAFDRAKNLRGQELVSAADFDAADAAASSATATVKTAEAAIEQARASLRISEVSLEHATILSPVDGIVISRNVDVGQTVAASLQAPTLFTIAQDLRKMQVHMNVAESDIGRLAVGQSVSFTVDAYPEARFSGLITEIRNAPTTIQNVVTYEAVIDVDNSDLRLKPGMTANISVIVDRKENALLVPNAALRFKPPEKIAANQSGQAADRRPAGDAARGTYPGAGPGTGPGTGRGDSSGPAAHAPPEGGSPEGRGAAEGSRRWEGRAGGRRPGAEASSEPSASAERRGPAEGGRRWEGRPGGMGQPGGDPPRRPGLAVWILKDGSLQRVPVTVGITDGAWTEVVSADLHENDSVVTELAGSQSAAARPNRPGFGRMF